MRTRLARIASPRGILSNVPGVVKHNLAAAIRLLDSVQRARRLARNHRADVSRDRAALACNRADSNREFVAFDSDLAHSNRELATVDRKPAALGCHRAAV